MTPYVALPIKYMLIMNLKLHCKFPENLSRINLPNKQFVYWRKKNPRKTQSYIHIRYEEKHGSSDLEM